MRPFLIAIPAVGIAFGFGLRVAGLEPPGPIGLGQSRPSRCCLRFWSRSGAACGEELAAAIVALMYAGGQYLETDAEGRAQRDMTALLARAPRTTIRLRDGKLEEIGIDLVAVGDRLLFCQGRCGPGRRDGCRRYRVLDQSAGGAAHPGFAGVTLQRN